MLSRSVFGLLRARRSMHFAGLRMGGSGDVFRKPGRVRCVDRAPPAFALGSVRTADPTRLDMEILLDEQP